MINAWCLATITKPSSYQSIIPTESAEVSFAFEGKNTMSFSDTSLLALKVPGVTASGEVAAVGRKVRDAQGEAR